MIFWTRVEDSVGMRGDAYTAVMTCTVLCILIPFDSILINVVYISIIIYQHSTSFLYFYFVCILTVYI